MKKLLIVTFAMGLLQLGHAQSITTSVPKTINTSEKYLFYLHGAIVQQQGANAVSEEYGPYEYQKILDTLAGYGFHVISEVRPKATKVEEYAKKVSLQIDTLLKAGVEPENIIMVGASMGAFITIETAHKVHNDRVKYAVLGLCAPSALDYYQKYTDELCGNFLSIFEQSDTRHSCSGILSNTNCKTGFKEIELHMDNGHGFLFKPYPEWVLPLVEWINKS